MFTQDKLSQNDYASFLSKHDNSPASGFIELAKNIIDRVCEQNNKMYFDPEILEKFAKIVWDTCIEYGLPNPVPKDQKEKPNPIDPEELTELMVKILDKMEDPEERIELAVLGIQLIKSLVQPEFPKCRLSYCKNNDAGVCERQNLQHSKQRISGAHCVDCPLFVLTKPAKHPKVLISQWDKSKQDELKDNIDVFLPADFRQLRYFLHLYHNFGKDISASEQNN